MLESVSEADVIEYVRKRLIKKQRQTVPYDEALLY
jgi:hypothetical protein